jgi:hypothetical protein
MTDTPTPQGSDTPALPEPAFGYEEHGGGSLFSADQMRALMAERDAAREEAAGWQAQMARDLDKLLAVAAERDALRREVEAMRAPVVSLRTCAKHEGQLWSMTVPCATVGRYVCPICEPDWQSVPAPPSADGGAT